MEDAEQYQVAGSGASETYPVQCSSLRKNGFVMLKGRPCRIVEMTTSKTGQARTRQGAPWWASTSSVARSMRICRPSTHNIDVPNVNRSDFQLIDISDDGFVTLMNDKGDTRDDLKLPEGELGQKIRERVLQRGHQCDCDGDECCGQGVQSITHKNAN
uniref:Eukaryotic translation initiation factor 5A n=1 Tax=Ixodes ricinus TaxID=34613 RepID=A0A090XE17_IXORI